MLLVVGGLELADILALDLRNFMKDLMKNFESVLDILSLGE
jgi:hypothetical protein